MTTIWTPIAPNKTPMKSVWYFTEDGATGDRYAAPRKAVVDRWLRVAGQDITVLEAQQIARASSVADDVKFSPFREEYPHLFQSKVIDALS